MKIFNWLYRSIVALGKFLPRSLNFRLQKQQVLERRPDTRVRLNDGKLVDKTAIAKPKPKKKEGPSFADYKLDRDILDALKGMGYQSPTPIQAKAIPAVLTGKDFIGLAQTGSGKTAACAIPVCQKVDPSLDQIQALIVVPTRELALQYAMEVQKIGKKKKIKVFAVYGGDDMDIQQAKLKGHVHVLVATPGRLIDLIYRRMVELGEVKTFILDEADEMLSMGFYEDLDFLFGVLVQRPQVLLYSATMPQEIRDIAMKHMHDPVEIQLTLEEAAPKQIEHFFVHCHPKDRDQKLEKLIKDQKPKQSIIFCESRVSAEKLFRSMKGHLSNIDFIHGGLSQDLRTSITHKFRRGVIKHLIATDVAARGLDFSGVTHVFLYQLPKDTDLYIHRSGRTGRADRKGQVFSLVSDREFYLLRKVLERVQRKPKWVGEEPESFHAKEKPRRGESKAKRPQGDKRREQGDKRGQQNRRRRPPRKPKPKADA